MTPSSHTHTTTSPPLRFLAQRYRRHVPQQSFSLSAVRRSRQTYILIRDTLTSRRTAVGYGTGARVRTLVPSRILPRASPLKPNSCSQGDLADEGRGRGGRERELPVRLSVGLGGVEEDRRWTDGEMVGCVLLSLSLPSVCLPWSALRCCLLSSSDSARRLVGTQ